MNQQPARRSTGGRIDRTRPIQITVDGRDLPAYPGDTVASAMLASDVHTAAHSIYRHRPRGLVSAGVDEPNALLRVEGQCSESMLPATTVEAYDGLQAETLSGVGRLDPTPDEAVYDRRYVHTDVLVIGAGPAGLAAATTAARSDARVMLIDEQPELGGSLLASRDEQINGSPAAEWVASVADDLHRAGEVTVLMRTTAFSSYQDNYVLAVQRRTDHLGERTPAGEARQRVWHIRARQVVLATGAHERPLVFADNDRPGVMLAAAVRTYLNRYAVLPGRRVVVATTNDSAYDTVADLHAAGVSVAAVVDARPSTSPRATAVLAQTGVEGIAGSAVIGTHGAERVTDVEVSALDDDGALAGPVRGIDCDLLAVSGGWSPVVHLHSQRQGQVRWDGDVAGFVPDGGVQDQQVVGSANGGFGLGDCLQQGVHAGVRAATTAGFPSGVAETAPVPQPSTNDTDTTPGPVRPLWLVPAASGEPSQWDTHFVDLQRDATVADVVRAIGAGMSSVEHVKRYTSIGTAADQGKTSAVNTVGLIATHLGYDSPGEVGTTTFRPPYTPVAFAAMAGRQRGELFDPVRTTPIHAWHVERGAEMEIVGQWHRPRYYPHDGEDMHAAVARECRAARSGVAMQDVSTLGKIEVVGPDAGVFLNRVYTGGFTTLAVGAGRYSLMCKPDGMIFDDGVTLRLDENHYLMTTTTGGAAAVLDWLEELLQTEWPELRVYLTSVTEQWSTVAVVGPRSREVLAQLAPELDVSNDAFGFMQVRETTLASGVSARICRISFSGELAFEINVNAWYGRTVWEEVWAAGQPFGITPYGTEAMHVLRAEKGFIIVGQDTDGTVTPQDAGMDWAVSKKKDFFIGKRSFTRPDTARGGRKQLVGLLPVDTQALLPEGAQLVAEGVPITPDVGPVPMLGHVTSSYHSQTLGRTFALGLLSGGRDRMGETVVAPLGKQVVPVEVTHPVLFDPEGARRDG